MNARLAANVLRKPTLTLAPPPARKTMSRSPMALTKGPRFGKPDPVLARMVFRNLVDTTPAIVIPANPLADMKVRKELRHFGVAFHHE